MIDPRRWNAITPTAEVDLHGYHPDEVCGAGLEAIIQRAWEMGSDRIVLIHGHGRNRGISPGFVNTNTGYFGLCIRGQLRHNESLRQWIKYTTLDCGHDGSTTVALKKNANPMRVSDLGPAQPTHPDDPLDISGVRDPGYGSEDQGQQFVDGRTPERYGLTHRHI